MSPQDDVFRAPTAIRPLRGSISVPGDKSISHRALILAALAPGSSVISGINAGGDVRATCDALERIGAASSPEWDKHVVEVKGCGWSGLREPDDVVDARNSATTLRSLLGVCAAVPLGVALSGDATLRRRPMLRVVEPLRAMGAWIDGRRGGDLPPLWVRGGRLRGLAWQSPVASAQLKTALLLAGLRAEGTTSVTEPARSRDHSERMLRAAGVRLTQDGLTVSVEGGQAPRAGDRRVPGDISAAMFLIVAATLVEGSDLTIRGVGLNPTRTGALDVLARMGADLTIDETEEHGGEPVGNVSVRASPLQAAHIGGAEVPRLIDEIPILAVAASQAAGRSVVSDAAELTIKESNRIDAVVAGLRAMGVDAEGTRDGLTVSGPARLRRARIDSRGDHRIARSFAVAGLASSEPLEIEGWSCVETSFPQWTRAVAAARGDPT